MRDEEEQVVLVDGRDRTLGAGPKLSVHRAGLRHRAFSVFLFDPDGAVLLQSRAFSKYHSGGLWSNACCGHPRVGERVRDAAARRLFEELGLRIRLRKAGRLSYRADLPGGWQENEIVHLFTATCTEVPAPDPAEVRAWRWIDPAELATDAAEWPEQFTAWLGIYLRTLPEVVLGKGRREAAGPMQPSRASVVARPCQLSL